MRVTGIIDLEKSPHACNKKVYSLPIKIYFQITTLQESVLICINCQKENILFVLNLSRLQ